MSGREIAELCEALPPGKREEVADFARFLLARQDEERWESLIDDPKSRPKLEAFLRNALAEGDEPFDVSRL